MNQPAHGDTQGWADYIRANPYHNMPQPLRRAEGFEPLKLVAVTERLREWAEPDGDNDQHTQVREDVKWLLASHLHYYQQYEKWERAYWWRQDTEDNGNIAVSWRERAEELETKLEAAKKLLRFSEEVSASLARGMGRIVDQAEMRELETAREVLNG